MNKIIAKISLGLLAAGAVGFAGASLPGSDTVEAQAGEAYKTLVDNSMHQGIDTDGGDRAELIVAGAYKKLGK
ncbi:hypothetical protein LWC34_33715 [Kibdelosporangium philippinense]|uniref:Uncharacterized protein n=1 Tax=Kibdelosporangium philippinense TaxID=211113 RepID=A0ABS8ZJM5_9PSEU|nr:hypothetical protein [Kibdelosporangium philippinense]MCE7007742.1 hypothetical protein [Kibdelosporangium philippinense]